MENSPRDDARGAGGAGGFCAERGRTRFRHAFRPGFSARSDSLFLSTQNALNWPKVRSNNGRNGSKSWSETWFLGLRAFFRRTGGLRGERMADRGKQRSLETGALCVFGFV